MNREWDPPTPIAMLCPDCKGIIPRGSIRHECDTGGKKVSWVYKPKDPPTEEIPAADVDNPNK